MFYILICFRGFEFFSHLEILTGAVFYACLEVISAPIKICLRDRGTILNNGGHIVYRSPEVFLLAIGHPAVQIPHYVTRV